MHFLETLDGESREAEWRFDRAAWVVLALVVVLLAAGAFGGGPFGRGSASASAEGIDYALRYDAMNRVDHVSLLFVEVRADKPAGDELTIAWSQELVAVTTIRSSVPASDGGGLGEDGASYTFQVEDWSQPLVVSFEYLPERVGWTEGAITITAGDGAPVELPFRQFAYP